MIKKAAFTEAEHQHYRQIEASINHWSIEWSRSQLAADRLKGATEAMYEAQMQLMNGTLKAADIDPSQVVRCHVQADGSIEVHVSDAKPEGQVRINPEPTTTKPPSDP